MLDDSTVAALRAAAEDPIWRDDITLVEATPLAVRVTMRLRGADFEITTFHLTIERRTRLAVREDIVGTRLPAACPERHINGDGTFCLSWRPIPDPVDSNSASEFWGRVAGFLEQQLRANQTSAWPANRAWPHGAAAQIQEQIEALEAALPVPLRGDAELREDGKLVHRRRRCACGKKRQLRRCHEQSVLQLMTLRVKRAAAERAFWASWTHPCCHTMNDCPLSKEV